jgi:hypothetical protein
MTGSREPDFDPYAEPDPLSNEADNAYGDLGADVGLQAQMLLEYLSQPLLESERDERGWYYPEGDALTALVELEWLVPHIRPTGDVLTDEMGAFATRLAAFRLALPVTEAERYWLHHVRDAVDPHSHWFETQIGEADDEVISLGLRTRIDGGDLLRRWRAWRRETDEYDGQGTLDLAREALRGVAQLLLPDEPLPESYRKLRGLPDEKDQQSAD